MENRKFTTIISSLFVRAVILLFLFNSCEPPEYPEPIITSIEPTSGSPGTPVIIKGKYLNNVSGILFGTIILANNEYSLDPTQPNTIIVEVPVQTPGDVLVAFENNGNSSNGLNFKVLPVKPDIELIEPESAKIGDKITLVGKYFSNDLKIHFTGATPSEIEFKNDKVITSVIPNGATSGLVYLTGDNGIYSDSVYYSISEPVSGAPSISKIEPASGKIGDVIIIEGNNFQVSPIIITLSNYTLTQNTDYTIDSNNRISLTLPSNSKSGPLIIRNVEGEDGRNFLVTGPPMIERVLPVSNKRGGPIIIFGKNLEHVDKIEFGSTLLLKPNFSYFQDYDGVEILYGRVPNATPGNTGLILSGPLSGNSSKFDYNVLSGEQLQLPLGFNNVIFPYSPQSPSFFSMNNQWTGNIIDDDRLGILVTDYMIKDEYYGLLSGGESIGFYKKDGSFIYIRINGVPYEGRRDPDFSGKGVSRVILTPLESGTQVELIFPLFIEKINPAVISPGEILTITGRYFNELEFFDFDAQVLFGETQFFNRFEDTPEEGFVWGSRTELKIKIPENAVPGNYIIKVGSIGFESNEVSVQVIN
ncbi:IPT/TIG domain-containing protein [Aquiflexum lacus]|uniref:IPT/TIG domain-containing protein n=1 Tax=Aquiflexum lacus TaxID=2483805 RepID=UPI001893F86D|nr:IPT/TIG domain-containing protein [Aquiflexum lacus]